MIYEPNEITTSTFEKFISSNQICVLKANAGVGLGFNKILQSQFQQHYKGIVNFGVIDSTKIDYKNKAIQNFVKIAIPKIGLRNVNAIFPGYYLFKNGILVAFHPGTIDPTKIDAQLHGFAMLFGAIAGLIVGLSEKDGMKGLETFLQAMEAPVSFKVFQFFQQILGARNQSSSQQQQKVVYDDELLNAYKLLQVSPDATDAEINKAWRAMQLKHHPDLHPNNVTAKTKLCAELNNAHDLIKKSRAKGKKK